jgi:hypothetical protein
MITSIVITNSAASAATYTIALNGVDLATTVSVPANDSAHIEPKQAISAGQTISGLASAVTVKFHITGLEMT